MVRKIRLHPIEKEILRYLDGRELGVTATEIAEGIGVHSATAGSRLLKLYTLGLVIPEKRGNRTYYKINYKGLESVEIVNKEDY